jgi:hypothetical protein
MIIEKTSLTKKNVRFLIRVENLDMNELIDIFVWKIVT